MGDVIGEAIGVAMGDVTAGTATPPIADLAFDDTAAATATDAPRAVKIAFGARLSLPREPPSLALADAAAADTLGVPPPSAHDDGTVSSSSVAMRAGNGSGSVASSG